MEITNFNYITIIIFLFITGFFGYLFFVFYKKSLYFNKKYSLLSSGKYFYMKYVFLLFSFLMILLSIFGIKMGEIQTKNEAKGVDMMFVLDVSKSMNVADITDNNYAYTRLDSIKKSIANYVSKHVDDRFGLVIFAGDAVSTVPLTTDHDIFLTFLENVDYRNLTVQGSNFEKAISLGVDRFATSDDRSKILAFVSDGGDIEDQVNYENISSISKKIPGINYFVVGIGTQNGGQIITGRDPFGRVNYQTYNGEYVVSKLNENNLEKINNAINGKYIKVSKVDDLFSLDKYINNLEKKVLKTDVNGEIGNGGRILSMISLLFFMIFLGLYASPYPNLSPKGRKEQKNIS